MRKFLGLAVLLVAVSGCSPDIPATPTQPTWSTSSPVSATSAQPTSTAAPALTASETAAPVSPAPAAETRATTTKKTATKKSTRNPKLTCEPDAPARLVGNEIVNKACPELNAAKERAQREFAEQQARQESEAALRACREQPAPT